MERVKYRVLTGDSSLELHLIRTLIREEVDIQWVSQGIIGIPLRDYLVLGLYKEDSRFQDLREPVIDSTTGEELRLIEWDSTVGIHSGTLTMYYHQLVFSFVSMGAEKYFTETWGIHTP